MKCLKLNNLQKKLSARCKLLGKIGPRSVKVDFL